jgi:hypothetical protein
LSVGALELFRKTGSLAGIVSQAQRRLALASAALLLAFDAIVTLKILLSNLVL